MKTDNIDGIEKAIQDKVSKMEKKIMDKNDVYSPKDKIIDNRFAKWIKQKYDIFSAKILNKKFCFMYQDGYWKKVDKEYIESLVIKEIDENIEYKKREVDSVVGIAISADFKTNDELNKGNNLINLENVTYDLDSYLPREHKKEDYLLYKNPYRYEPEAQCPEFEKALRKYSIDPKSGQPDEDWLKTIWEILGYIMLGVHPHQKMFWFFGPKGRNGKGSILRVAENLVGIYFTFSDLSFTSIGGRFYKVNFIGKRLATIGDMPVTLDNVDIIKELTGGDMQSTDTKFGDTITFKMVAKIVGATNNMPYINSNQSLTPFIRRIILLPFDYVISDDELDYEIENKFMEELPGIFNKAIEGLKRLRANNRFTDTNRGKEILKRYSQELDPFEEFINDFIELDESAVVIGVELFSTYSKFIDELNFYTKGNDSAINRNAFYNKIEEAFPEAKKIYVQSNLNPSRKGKYVNFNGIRINKFV